jgi:hypothetical protein
VEFYFSLHFEGKWWNQTLILMKALGWRKKLKNMNEKYRTYLVGVRGPHWGVYRVFDFMKLISCQ